jgi:hypothetical protein
LGISTHCTKAKWCWNTKSRLAAIPSLRRHRMEKVLSSMNHDVD